MLLPDLSAEGANRWPAFAAAALAAGVRAEFSLPLTVGPVVSARSTCAVTGRACSLRNIWRMLWWRRTSPVMPCCTSSTRQGGRVWPELLATAGADRLVIHQATGMIAAQLDDTVANALARLRAAAFASGRSMYDIAQDVVERRVRFDE